MSLVGYRAKFKIESVNLEGVILDKYCKTIVRHDRIMTTDVYIVNTKEGIRHIKCMDLCEILTPSDSSFIIPSELEIWRLDGIRHINHPILSSLLDVDKLGTGVARNRYKLGEQFMIHLDSEINYFWLYDSEEKRDADLIRLKSKA